MESDDITLARLLGQLGKVGIHTAHLAACTLAEHFRTQAVQVFGQTLWTNRHECLVFSCPENRDEVCANVRGWFGPQTKVQVVLYRWVPGGIEFPEIRRSTRTGLDDLSRLVPAFSPLEDTEPTTPWGGRQMDAGRDEQLEQDQRVRRSRLCVEEARRVTAHVGRRRALDWVAASLYLQLLGARRGQWTDVDLVGRSGGQTYALELKHATLNAGSLCVRQDQLEILERLPTSIGAPIQLRYLWLLREPGRYHLNLGYPTEEFKKQRFLSARSPRDFAWLPQPGVAPWRRATAHDGTPLLWLESSSTEQHGRLGTLRFRDIAEQPELNQVPGDTSS
ncbi:hypothetical protein E5F05_01905 (plasmid) [Deinococcus metallilatus]|uniref:DUF3883 domain-containing protein n=1 Tax=Deinococcus metallilatus TaxID=1211322 RepID=A0ABR6N2Q0_9DEIO|nr:hypothetical protein [Deinococcus metallilatus]MBB5297477.1 hypothetical protein [Deinococcus metallilatus]QBY06726.1 hypothetical protein E5F05_01905 [Deinococcus metallilatus]GMA14379.1 hypothetical protein GCM10025871_07100 [Deinococcus metallilatus]